MGKRTLLILIIIFISMGYVDSVFGGDKFGYLREYIDKYPEDQFFNLPEIKNPLMSLLGSEYKHFKQNTGVVVPMDFIQGNLVATGCQSHNCLLEKSIMTFKLYDGKITVGILSDCKKVTIFSQETDNFEYMPEAIKRWFHECRRECGKDIQMKIIKRE